MRNLARWCAICLACAILASIGVALGVVAFYAWQHAVVDVLRTLPVAH